LRSGVNGGIRDPSGTDFLDDMCRQFGAPLVAYIENF